MAKKSNNRYKTRKKMTYETIVTVAKLKDLSKLIYAFVSLAAVLLIVSLFVGATDLDAKFASVNDQATQQITGAIYSYVPLVTNITIAQYAFGVANVELGTVFDGGMLIGFIFSLASFVIFFIPLKKELKSLNKFKYFLSGAFLIVGSVITFTSLTPLTEVFDQLLYDMITYGKYDANQSETSATISVYSYIVFVVSILSSLVMFMQAGISYYREKNDANY